MSEGLGVLVAVLAAQRLNRELRAIGDAGEQAQMRAENARIAELEHRANAQVVAPIRPPLPPAQRIAATSGAFEFGVPHGFGRLPAPMLERWIESAGPTLATVVDAGAEDLPMLISVSPPARVDPDVARGFWRLSLDLAGDVRRGAQNQGLSVTEGPDACRIGQAPAIEFGATSHPGGVPLRNRTAVAVVRDEAFEVTMNVRPAEEARYLPVWWTVLGTWIWLSVCAPHRA